SSKDNSRGRKTTDGARTTNPLSQRTTGRIRRPGPRSESLAQSATQDATPRTDVGARTERNATSAEEEATFKPHVEMLDPPR
ncbi:Hypothetical predicted protein, partial [Paramuricea clavata]